MAHDRRPMDIAHRQQMRELFSRYLETLPRQPVILLSPYRARDAAELVRNLRYLRACLRDSALNHNEAPYASHRMMTEALDDSIPEEREIGMACEAPWAEFSAYFVCYTDLGVSPGMQRTIDNNDAATIKYRQIPDWDINDG